MTSPRRQAPLAATALACALLCPAGAAAGERPISAVHLELANAFFAPAGVPFFRLLSRDAALVPPFGDPRQGAALVIGSSAQASRCRIEIVFDPARWHAGENQESFAYFERVRGEYILFATLRAGRLSVVGLGSIAECADAAPLPLPLVAELRLSDDRLCTSFGGRVQVNQPGQFRATRAPAPAGCRDADVTVANLNMLHGLGCDPDQCRLADRVELLFDWIESAGCPDIVTLQEVVERSGSISARALIEAQLASRCPFAYTLLFRPVHGLDEELVLSRYPILASEVRRLHTATAPGFTRHVLFARVDHPLAPVDVFTTHLSSGSDLAEEDCDADGNGDGVVDNPCPAACAAAGAATTRECQAVQLAQLVEELHDVPGPAVVTGDFNAEPFGFVYDQLADRGFADVYLDAGNPECDAATGVGCTSGRESALAELESTEGNVVERIDYIFLVPPAAASACLTPELDPASDDDGDGSATRLFADLPNPFEPACGAAPAAICWPADHEGVELDLNCAR